MLKHIVLISLIIAFIFISVLAVAQEKVKIEPNLEPGKVYSAVEMPEAWYIGSVLSYGIKGVKSIRTAWGKNFSRLSLQVSKGDCMSREAAPQKSGKDRFQIPSSIEPEGVFIQITLEML